MSTTTRRNDEASDTAGGHSIVWPPPDEVLQKMTLVDFVTGEMRPLELDTLLEPVAELDEQPEQDIRAAPVCDSRVAGGRRRRASTKRTLWLLAVVSLLGSGTGVFVAWKLMARELQTNPLHAPTVLAERPPAAIRSR